MWKLDTLVRDVIPDDVYNAYNRWKHITFPVRGLYLPRWRYKPTVLKRLLR
jgi:hypothetical protein